jgi:hypothetical protein
VNKIESFNTQEERVFVDVGVTMWWKDKTLVGKTGDDFPKDKIFNPTVEIEGSFKMRQCISPETGGSVQHEYFHRSSFIYSPFYHSFFLVATLSLFNFSGGFWKSSLLTVLSVTINDTRAGYTFL